MRSPACRRLCLQKEQDARVCPKVLYNGKTRPAVLSLKGTMHLTTNSLDFLAFHDLIGYHYEIRSSGQRSAAHGQDFQLIFKPYSSQLDKQFEVFSYSLSFIITFSWLQLSMLKVVIKESFPFVTGGALYCDVNPLNCITPGRILP